MLKWLKARVRVQPILFWGRVFLSAQRRQREIDAEAQDQDRKQKDRDVSCCLPLCMHPFRLSLQCHALVIERSQYME